MQQKYIGMWLVSCIHNQTCRVSINKDKKGTVEKGTAEKILKWSQNEGMPGEGHASNPPSMHAHVCFLDSSLWPNLASKMVSRPCTGKINTVTYNYVVLQTTLY